MQNDEWISLLPPREFEDDLWTRLRKDERPILVYGMGNGADKLLARLQTINREVSDFFASDAFVRGQSFHGKRVLTFREAKEKYDDFIVLVCFGSHLRSVIDDVYSLADECCLYIPDMPLASDEYFDASFYRAHYDEIVRAYLLLADDISKRVFASTLHYKLTGKLSHLIDSAYAEDEKALCTFHTLTAALDVGAYRGDTVRELLECAPHLEYVLAIEPDRRNFKRLKEYADTVSSVEIECIQAAAWMLDGELSFAESGNRNAALSVLDANASSYKHKTKTVNTVKIDTLLQGRRKIDYIKYDTEGVECEALVGTREVIRSYAPTLLVSAYHKSEDMFSLLLLLDDLSSGSYEYYMRRRECFPAWDLNLIARKRRI